ncbi:MAG: acyltransferase family protein [Quadrisphaera sp.]
MAGWCWVYGLVGLFLKALAGGSPVVRYLADSSYWVYIAHLPLTAVIQLLLAKTGWVALGAAGRGVGDRRPAAPAELRPLRAQHLAGRLG